jgi:hypothetical protein
MGLGREFQKRNSAFLKFDEEGVIEGIFEGMKCLIKDNFGEEREVMRYKINGKTFDSISGKLAVLMDDVRIGEHIRIVRSGTGKDTEYDVIKLDKKNEENISEISGLQ